MAAEATELSTHSTTQRAGTERWLLARLAQVLQPAEISMLTADLETNAVDRSGHRLPGTPLAVLRPTNTAAVQAILRITDGARVTVVPRGAGSGLSGGASVPDGALVLSTERLNSIITIDPDNEIAIVQPGVLTAAVDAAAAEHGLMHAPDPASHEISTIGGNIATNAGGLRCAKYGVTRESVLGLTVVLPDGSVLRTGRQTIKGVVGYDLTALFVGSEGTLGVVVEATLRLRPRPVKTRTAVAFFPSIAAAAAGLTGIIVPRAQPSVLELLDAGALSSIDLAQGTQLRGRGAALVIAQTDGTRDAVADLTGLVEDVHLLAEPLGVELISSGTHPFTSGSSSRSHQAISATTPLIDRTRWWGRQMMIWGVHVHVAVEDRAKVLPINDGLLHDVPHVQELSASSPFWSGETTGYASNRALMFQQLPTAGLPPQFTDWQQYEAMTADMIHTGVIDELGELRWDIRPSPKWGTIEVGTFDGISTPREIGAIAALTQCLAEHFSRELDAGHSIPSIQPWFIRENKWRAARYGMDAIIIQNGRGDERLVTEDLHELLPLLAPVAQALGCSAELENVADIVDHGASYQRQPRVAAANDGSLKAVVASLIRELREGRPTDQ